MLWSSVYPSHLWGIQTLHHYFVSHQEAPPQRTPFCPLTAADTSAQSLCIFLSHSHHNIKLWWKKALIWAKVWIKSRCQLYPLLCEAFESCLSLLSSCSFFSLSSVPFLFCHCFWDDPGMLAVLHQTFLNGACFSTHLIVIFSSLVIHFSSKWYGKCSFWVIQSRYTPTPNYCCLTDFS